MHQAVNISSTKRNEEIEVLRAIAILFVVVSHLPNLFIWGNPALNWINTKFQLWTGVDLFLCISGFVIGRILWEKLDDIAPQFYWREVVSFWIRRAYRIIPSAWLWLFIVLGCSFFFNKSTAFGSFWGNLADTVASILHFQDFHFGSCLKHLGSHVCGNLGNYWSLSLEEQFYIFCPLLFLLPRKFTVYALLLIVAVQLPFNRMEPESRIILFTRTDAISLGVLLAWVARNKAYSYFEPTALAHWGLRWIVFSTLILAVGLIAAQSGLVLFPVGLVAVVSLVLVFIASYDRGYLMRKGLLRSMLCWVGSRSFAIYLIHVPVFSMTKEIWFRLMPAGTTFNGTFSLRFGFMALFFIVVFVELNYRFIETPFRERGKIKASEFLLRT